MLVGIPGGFAITAPTYLRAAFNPLTLESGVAALAAIAIIAGRDLPSATRCCRNSGSIQMRSIYEQALGKKFQTPAIRVCRNDLVQQYGRRASIGKGTMDEIWRGKFFTLPFLYAGSWRRISFRSTDGDPFTIRNFRTLTLFGKKPSHGFGISIHAILGARCTT